MGLRSFVKFIFVAIIVIYFLTWIPFNNGFTRKTELRRPRIYKPTEIENPSKSSKFGSGKAIIGAAVAGAAILSGVGLIAVPALSTAFGIGSTGVIAGSYAAALQSYLGGTIASGSSFAILQSVGMAGLSTTTLGILGTIGAISGSQVGKILISGEELSVDLEMVEALFDKYDVDEDDSISNRDLKKILKQLEPEILYDIDTRYFKATKRKLTDIGKIKYSEYVKLFNLKVFEGEELKKMLEGPFEEKKDKNGNVYCHNVKDMLPDLRVNSPKEFDDVCYFVTNGLPYEPISFIQFLNIFGLS